MNFDREREERLFARRYVVQDTETNCWIWKGKLNRSGYGSVGIKDVETNKWCTVVAHRWSYILFNNNGLDIPEGEVVRHKCNNKSCVNPDHLVLGTHLDNIEDAKIAMIEKIDTYERDMEYICTILNTTTRRKAERFIANFVANSVDEDKVLAAYFRYINS